jgi:pimeloyl-ACP methyl ester carboxylesterase
MSSSLALLRANGIDISYDEEGQGRPVLFIQGGFGGAESTLFPKRSAIKGVLPQARFRTISFDRRNCGRSQYVNQETRLEDLAADARGVLEALNIERAIVVGDSLGGMVALRFALDYPEAVDGLVVMESSGRILRGSRRMRAAVVALNLLGPRIVYRIFRRQFLQSNWSKPMGGSPSGVAAKLVQAHQLDLQRRLEALPDETLYEYSMGIVRTYVAFLGRDIRNELPSLRMPVRIIHANADPLVGVHHGRELARLIPGAALTELAGLGHGLFNYPQGRDALRIAVESLVEQDALVAG